LKFRSLVFVLLLFFCKKKEEFQVIDLKLLEGDFRKFSLSKEEFILYSNLVYSSDIKICKKKFNEKNFRIEGEAENGFIFSEFNAENSIRYKLYSNSEKNKLILQANCCTTEYCYESKAFIKKNDSLEFIIEDQGEMISFNEMNSNLVIKTLEPNITNLIFVKKISKDTREIIAVLEDQNIQIPNQTLKINLQPSSDLELKLNKRPTDLRNDYLFKKFILDKESKIFLLAETKENFFLLSRADSKSTSKILTELKGEGKPLLNKIILDNQNPIQFKELESILLNKFIFIGWVDKTILE
jgi:hypothetical protein